MNPRQKLRKELDDSGAVVPFDKLSKLYAPTEAPKQAVVQTLEFGSGWHPLAIQKMINFFDQARQLKQTYRADGKTYLVVSFNDEAQAQAFSIALSQGHFGKITRN